MAQLTCQKLCVGYDGRPVLQGLDFEAFAGDYLFTTADGQDRGVTAVCYGGPAQSRRSIYRRLLLGSGIL